jgi:uncharacterized protein YkwD
LARIATGIINDERRRIGVDTLEYEADTFCFATDWADSTHRFFNVENHKFTRKDAHRNCEERMDGYETSRNREWRYFAECVAFGSMDGKESPVKHFTEALLGSKDHYKVLMKKGYKKIRIGILIKDGFFNMVVFTTTEYE